MSVIGGGSGEATRSTTLLIDALMILWTAAWIAVGVLVGIDVHHLSQLTVTLGHAGKSLHQVGGVLQSLSHLPLVGGTIGKAAKQVTATAASARSSAASSRSSVDQLAYLLAIVIFAIPFVSSLAIYLPFRIRRIREARAVRAALRNPEALPYLERYLAERALANLSFHELRRITPQPWVDVEQGRYSKLAAAELARLGFTRRTWQKITSRRRA